MTLPTLILFALPGNALAAELAWDGHYRARMERFNSLSLSDSNAQAEGPSMAMDHQLRLQPGWRISDKVSLFAQLDLLPYVYWGDEVDQRIDPLTQNAESVVFSENMVPPTDEEGGASHQNLMVRRAWADVNLGWGTLRFGRAPHEWGSGMVFNAGNDPLDEFGDSSDRVQLTALVGQVYLIGAVETRYEGFVNESDDYVGVSAGVLYQKEQASLGTYHTYRWQNQDDSRFTNYIGDVWGQADVGPAEIEIELAGVLGGGDLDTGENDISLGAFGSHLGVFAQPEKLRLGLGLGVATGDADPEDTKIKTFSFDRDFNQALLMFNEPMPTLGAVVPTDANGGRTTEAARTGYSLSNAIYVRPQVGWEILEGLTADLSFFAAQAAKMPEDETDLKGYGSEVDLQVKYAPFEHFWTQATAGVFLPGKYYSEYEHDDLGGGFDSTAVGFQLVGVVEF